jgi:hypothetical protein
MDVTASLFKPVEGGYVFRAPYQLGVGKARHYLVSEAEMAALVAAIAGRRPALTRAGLALACGAAAIVAMTLVFVFSPHRDPAISDTIAMLALTFALILTQAAAWRFWKLRRLAPMFARLTPTELAITRAEMRRAMFAGMSTSKLWMITILCGIAGAFNIASSAVGIWDGRNAFSGIVSGTIFTGIAVYYALHLMSRLEKKPSAG